MTKQLCNVTVGCLVKFEEAIVFVYEEQEGVGAWDIPAGGIERDESPEIAIRRELLEEVNLVAPTNLRLSCVFWSNHTASPTVHFLYECTIDAKILSTIRPNCDDIVKTEVFTKENIKTIIKEGAYEHKLARERLSYFLSSPLASDVTFLTIQ